MSDPHSTSDGQFQHEKLHVYQVGRQFGGLAVTIAAGLRPPHGEIADQLRRAAISVNLNIAEGCAEYAKAEKRRILRFALRSAAECAAILDLAIDLGIIAEKDYEAARTLLLRVTAMLTSMVRMP